MNDDRPKKKNSFREQWKKAFGRISYREAGRVLKDTWKDWRKNPKEAGIFLAACIIPGGWIGYGAYRVEKSRRLRAANDNKPPRKDRKKKPGGPAP